MKEISIKKLLILIVTLLIVIALPTVKSGYELVVSSIDGWIYENKKSFCRRKYPEYVIKAMSEEELMSFVDKKLSNDTDGVYSGMYQNTYTNPRGLSTREMLIITFSRSLEDRLVFPGDYDSSSNRCVSGGAYVGDTLEWYTF